MPDVATAPRLRALIYNRVSADPSGRRISVESQDGENRAFCEREGWEIVATIVDNDRSASRFAAKEREGYGLVRQALDGTTHGRIDVLVCWESSRAQRDLADYVAMRDLCVMHQVRLAYKGRVYNLAEGDDRFSTGIDALVDEREAERIRERVLRGHRTSVSQGKPRGIVPFGYVRHYDQVGGHLINQTPDPETAPIVQEIAARIIGGATLYSIAKDLNQRGILTPRGHRHARTGRDAGLVPGWTSSIIRNMLSKQSLMGIRTRGGVAHRKATWDPIITPADWQQVQTILADPHRARMNGGVAVRYLLSGIAECGVCGAWLRPFTNRGRPTYRCEGKVATDGRGHVARLREPLEAMATLYVCERLSDPRLVEEIAVHRQGAVKRTENTVREIADLQAELAQYIASAKTRKGLALQAFEAVADGLAEQIEAKQAELSLAAGVPPAVLDLAGPNARELWDAASLQVQRQVVRALVRVVVHRTSQRGAREFDASTVEITDG